MAKPALSFVPLPSAAFLCLFFFLFFRICRGYVLHNEKTPDPDTVGIVTAFVQQVRLLDATVLVHSLLHKRHAGSHIWWRLCADADCLKNLLPKGGETVQLTYCASYTYLRSSSLFYSGRHVYISNMSQPPEPELSLPFDYIIFVYSSEWAVPCVEVRGARCPKACLELAPSPTLRTNLLSLVSGRLNFPLLVLLTF